jgi:hypothetical protein
MKKEYALVTAAIFFLVAYLIDRLAGNVVFTVKNPVIFITSSVFLKYPFTSLAIALKAMGLGISIVLLMSFIEKAFFVKAFSIFVIIVFAELYAIQQTATGARTTTIQWTLSFAYAGAILLIPFVYYIIKGVVVSLYSNLAEEKKALPEENPSSPEA